MNRTLRLACCLALAACASDPAGPPPPLAGSYQLDNVDGNALPALVRAGETCDLLLETGSLQISSGGAEPSDEGLFQLALHGVQDCTRGGGASSPVGSNAFGIVSRSGSALDYRLVTPDDTVTAFTGSLSAATATLVLPDTSLWGRHTLLFARLLSSAAMTAAPRLDRD